MAPLRKILKLEYLFVLFLIISSSYLRFKDLGYSDYIGDEHKAFIEVDENETKFDFFMNQRKGPMQFLISHIPYLFTGDFRNELAQRIPFAIVAVLSVVAFYLLISKLTKDKYVGLLSAFLMSVLGFIVGFGRIAQYQNLNLLFSFLSLYFYSDLLFKKDNVLKSTLLGTLFFSFSLLSHWDAIFILPLILYIFINYFKSQNFSKREKTKLVLTNFLAGCLFLLPFLVPYFLYQIGHEDNLRYFERRVDSSEEGFINIESFKEKIERYQLLFQLYNPFLFFEILIIGTILGLIFLKKSYPYILWFVFGFSIFLLFVRKPGTHLYNFVLPVVTVASIGYVNLYKIFPKMIKPVYIITLLMFTSFLYFQAYTIFVDHKQEYPWEQKEIYVFDKFDFIHKRLKKLPKTKPPKEGEIAIYKWHETQYWKTPKYVYDQKLPLFGFPHRRYWNEINDWIKTVNLENNESFGYSTNEVKTISEWYIEEVYKTDGDYYYIGIKRPLSFVNDYKPRQIKNKALVHEIRNNGVNMVKIYRVQE